MGEQQPMTFLDILKRYRAEHLHKVVVSHARYNTIEKYLAAAFGKIHPEHLNQDAVDAYIKARRNGVIGKRGAAKDSTINLEITHLKTVLQFGWSRNLFKDMPRFKNIPTGKPKDRWLTKDEVKQVMEHLNASQSKVKDQAIMFVRIALATGARKQAILDLTWDRISPLGLIDFHDSERSNRSKRRSVVPATQSLLTHLAEHRKKYPDQTRVICENDGLVYRPIRAALESLDVPGATIHTFRHTWATHASMNGISFSEIARVLGNSSEMVERVYAKYAPDYLRHAVNTVDL